MAGLTDREKAMAWDACFPYSPTGIAIVDKDGFFRLVNPAFCLKLAVTPAQLLGKKYQDITTSETVRLDELNAKLVLDGQMDTYTLPKAYDFGNGYIPRKVKLTVGRAPSSDKGDFEFYVAQIVLDEDLPIVLPTAITIKTTPRADVFKLLGDAWRAGVNNGYKVATAIVIVLGGIFALLKEMPEIVKIFK